MDGAASGIGHRLHDLGKVIRLFKQRVPGERLALGMLMEIDRHAAGCHARELAVQAALDPSTVSRAVASLVAHGLVAREPDPYDGRATILVITPAGRAALDATVRWYSSLLERALADWTPDEIARFNHALARFTAGVEDALIHDNLEAAQ